MDLGIRHIDTADYYGPYVTNELIRAHLRENVAAAALQLPDDAIAQLDAIGG